MLTTACQPASLPHFSDRDIRVLSISSVEIDATASAQDGAPEICRTWSLTKDQAEKFFSFSTELDARTYYHEYDTAPCKLRGVVRAEGKAWEFTVNGAAKAVWVSGEDIRYLGCGTPSCEPLVMWPLWKEEK
jgi:hypothetical protein